MSSSTTRNRFTQTSCAHRASGSSRNKLGHRVPKGPRPAATGGKRLGVPQFHFKPCAFFRRLDQDRPIVALHDAFDDRQAHPRPVPGRRMDGIEDSRQYFRRNAGTVVFNHETNYAVLGSPLQLNRAAGGNLSQGVQNQVQQGPVEEFAIAQTSASRFGQEPRCGRPSPWPVGPRSFVRPRPVPTPTTVQHVDESVVQTGGCL